MPVEFVREKLLSEGLGHLLGDRPRKHEIMYALAVTNLPRIILGENTTPGLLRMAHAIRGMATFLEEPKGKEWVGVRADAAKLASVLGRTQIRWHNGKPPGKDKCFELGMQAAFLLWNKDVRPGDVKKFVQLLGSE